MRVQADPYIKDGGGEASTETGHQISETAKLKEKVVAVAIKGQRTQGGGSGDTAVTHRLPTA